ncbi:MAG TPA: winged helix DNA-binding domain-containing protein [Actinomycetota bacterium]|nr:winged helix DNA-binding domain-containing protein [Actinomycetota bacterium]
MTERVLSTRELNRALLARQLLLERSPLPMTTVIERIGGLQTQYAPSGYIGLWTRMREFHREQLTRALERRRVIQGWLMRVTIHMVSTPDYRLLAAGIGPGRRELAGKRPELRGVDMDEVARRIRHHLADGPRRAADLQGELMAEGYPRVAAVMAGLWVDLVRVPPSGTWERRRADLHELADRWLGPSDVTEEQGLEHVVRRYLGGFGPASVKDLAGWAGLPVSVVRPVVDRLSLRRFRGEDGSELIDLRGAPLPDPDTPAPVRFIPTWDATLLVHQRRTQILPEDYRDLVFNVKTPHSLSTFLVDGAVAGSWRYEGGRVQVEPFAPLPRTVRRQLEAEADRLAAFHA